LADSLKTNECSASSSPTGTQTASGSVSTDGTDRHAPLRPPKRSNAREMLWPCARNAQTRQTVYRQCLSTSAKQAKRSFRSGPHKSVSVPTLTACRSLPHAPFVTSSVSRDSDSELQRTRRLHQVCDVIRAHLASRPERQLAQTSSFMILGSLTSLTGVT